jgi:hypothetical protein
MAEREGCLTLLTRILKGEEPQTAQAVLPYHAVSSLLTPTEFAFYQVLIQIVGDKGIVCPKVRLADVVGVVPGTEKYMAHLGRISQKHIDFVICNPQTMEPLFAIELDDKSHQKERRQERDTFVNEVFQKVGIRLVHMPALGDYDLEITRKTLTKRLKEMSEQPGG